MLEAFAQRSVRVARLTLFAVAFAVAAIPGANGAHAQGLFEALFGGSVFQSPRPPVHIMRGEWSDEAGWSQPLIRKSSRPRIEATTKPGPYVAPEVMPGPLGRFLKDPTLKRGDVVVTAQGLMVFRGNRISTHRAKDFVPVTKSGPLLAKRTRTELAKLDQAVRSAGAAQFEPTRLLAASAPIVAQDESVTAR